jgi:hypothetical protein
MGSALRSVCRPDGFYDWIDLAGDDDYAGSLRIRWPQVLIKWRQQAAPERELMEILVSNPRLAGFFVG